MLDLSFTLAGLLLGPIAYRLSFRRDELYGFLDGFVLVGVAGLILAEVIPESVRGAGPAVLLFAAAGFVLPLALERRLALLPFSPNVFFRWLMIVGLILHQLLDGVALSKGIGDRQSLRLAVVLHQIPKGFFIWGMVGGVMGKAVGGAVMCFLCGATILGYAIGGELANALQSRWLFQAFIAFIGGGLLHVIAHHVPAAAKPHGACGPCGPGAHGAGNRRLSFWSGLGAVASLVGLITLFHERGPEAVPSAKGFTEAFLHLSVEASAPILLGLVVAGIFQGFGPKLLLTWLNVRGRLAQALRGVAIGLPLPLCSCGVVPVYLSLLRKNVPPAAALAFLIATPELGVDSFFISLNFLGLKITLIRIVTAFLIALAVGWALARTFERTQEPGDLNVLELPVEKPAPVTFLQKAREAFRVATQEILDHTGAWMLVGIAVSAVLEPYARPEWFAQVPAGLDVLLFSLLGLPLYVCAAGATPLAAVLIHKGVSTGAVLAFLITGPATNVTTFGILKRYHGVKSALLFALAVYVFSIACGFAINYLFPGSSAPFGEVLQDEHSALDWACAGVLAALFASTLLRLGPRGFIATLAESMGGPDRHAHSHSQAHSHEHHSHSHAH